jgi:hypothetical protein
VGRDYALYIALTRTLPKLQQTFDLILSMKMAIIFFTIQGSWGYFYDRNMRREIQNPQMFETDPESFFPAIFFRCDFLTIYIPLLAHLEFRSQKFPSPFLPQLTALPIPATS